MTEPSSVEIAAGSRFLRACRAQPVDRPPIWLMRQAGRYMPEYRALRSKHSMLDLVRNPELSAQVTLQPVEAFGMDAAILFADILTLLDGMGLGLSFEPGEGPRFARPIRTPEQVEHLHAPPPEEALGFTLEAARLARGLLPPDLPLIGFSGAPFTLACYGIEGRGSRTYALTRAFMHDEPIAWHQLMEKLAEAVGLYLRAQRRAGVQALQLFDTWAGLLSEQEYRTAVLPYTRRALELARDGEGPRPPLIYFARQGGHLLASLRETGADVFGIDHTLRLTEARAVLGEETPLQGNLDPDLLLGPKEPMLEQAAAILDEMRGQRGHIFNLGHGVIKETDPRRVAELVQFVQQSAGGTA